MFVVLGEIITLYQCLGVVGVFFRFLFGILRSASCHRQLNIRCFLLHRQLLSSVKVNSLPVLQQVALVGEYQFATVGIGTLEFLLLLMHFLDVLLQFILTITSRPAFGAFEASSRRHHSYDFRVEFSRRVSKPKGREE